MTAPEALARQQIDTQLTACGWVVQDYRRFNPATARGIALREVPLKSGPCDYLLLVDRKPVGVIEAKKTGTPLSTVAQQTADYAVNLPDFLAADRGSLPFLYESTGVETLFRDARDPEPKSRRVFAFHRPETLTEWIAQPDTLRARLRSLPPPATAGMRACQIEAIANLEASFAADRPRALIQMATGAGKTFTAVSFIYRLIKHAGARRVLFLVDRSNLGEQTKGEFDQYILPDDGRKFTQVYNVQHLASNKLDSVARVTVATIQRVYSILRGEELAEEADELSGFEAAKALGEGRSKEVAYNPAFPIETFDFIVTDECHRSIYNLWRQVLEYFDASLIGLTATPSKQTIGFFDQNLVMEYGHDRAVADGVNVGYDVYRIRTQVTEAGGKVEKGWYVDKRSKLDRKTRWEQLDEDLEYEGADLDRSVVVKSQIRTVLKAFRDALPELFPGRAMTPKTLIFAKDDSHAEDIVEIAREVFGKGNDFCQKITYRSFDAETRKYRKPKDMIAAFRNSPQLRIAVTVDMIATGTDIRPLECLVFMRDVKSRVYFEQMKGRGTRVLSPTELQAASGADAKTKDRFVIVDAVGVCESDKTDSRPLEKKPGVSFRDVMLQVAFGKRDEAALSSLASRLARLDRDIDPAQRKRVQEASGGRNLAEMAGALLAAFDPDRIHAVAARNANTGAPTEADLAEARARLAAEACAPFDSPAVREVLERLKQENEQVIDTTTIDVLLASELSEEAKREAENLIQSFHAYIEQHRAEIEALQVLYSRPYKQRLTEDMLKSLEDKLKSAPERMTRERLWGAYAKAVPGRIAGQTQRFTDLVSLVRFTLGQEPVLEPFEQHVLARYELWLANKKAQGIAFTDEERAWLEIMRDRVIASGSVDREALKAGNELGPAYRVFGERLWAVMDELNGVLVE
ncbi:MAG: restriction endonuclease subunit R [Rhodocyclales bacterium]|nr:MAG: restriction endonuclease subunit R [Rhodocyclales bacterium]